MFLKHNRLFPSAPSASEGLWINSKGVLINSLSQEYFCKSCATPHEMSIIQIALENVTLTA